MVDLPEPALTYFLEYDQFEELVREHFGREYDYVAATEGHNYSAHVYVVNDGVYPIDEETLEDWDHVSPHLVLDELCRRGVIPAGRYVVEIWW